MATPANRVPVRIARGTKANLDTAMAAGDLKEGEITYATDEDSLYVVEGGVLTKAGDGTGGGGGGSGIDVTGYSMSDGRLTAWDETAAAFIPFYPKGRPTTETSTTATYALSGPDASNYADQAAWEAAGWTFVASSINADDSALNFNPDATWLAKYQANAPMAGALPLCTDDEWTINSNGGIAWGGASSQTGAANAISGTIDAYFAPMSQDGKMMGAGHKIVTEGGVDYLVVRLQYQTTYNVAGNEIPMEVWFSETGGTQFRYGSKIGTPTFTISANNQGIFTKGTAISFDGTTTGLLGDGTTDLSTHDGGGGAGSDPAGYVVRYEVGTAYKAEMTLSDLKDFGNYSNPPAENSWSYNVAAASSSAQWWQDGTNIIDFNFFNDQGQNQSGAYPNVGLVGGIGTTVTLWLSTDQQTWTPVTGETLTFSGRIRFTTSPNYQVTPAPSAGDKLYVSTTDPGVIDGGPVADNDLLLYKNSTWSPVSFSEAMAGNAANIRTEIAMPEYADEATATGDGLTQGQVFYDTTEEDYASVLPTAAEIRTLLGIGEYVDDAAAGTGGVASGALYYNTTSSDYRLKV